MLNRAPRAQPSKPLPPRREGVGTRWGQDTDHRGEAAFTISIFYFRDETHRSESVLSKNVSEAT